MEAPEDHQAVAIHEVPRGGFQDDTRQVSQHVYDRTVPVPPFLVRAGRSEVVLAGKL